MVSLVYFVGKNFMAKNLAIRGDDEPKGLSVAKAAEGVSNDLDKVIHERMRLGIISALAANEKLSFTELKKLLATSDGNISVHARKLEEAGYITCEKSFKGRMPLTDLPLGPLERALLDSLRRLEPTAHEAVLACAALCS